MRPSATAHPDLIRHDSPRVRGVRLQFDPAVPWNDVFDTLDLAFLAVESLYGTDRVTLEARHEVEDAARSMLIETTTDVGRTLAILFLGFARRQYGDRAVEVIRGEGVTR